MTLEHKGITYQVVEGASVNENKSETLDSFPSIFISQLTSPVEFEPYDKVIVHTPIKDYYMDIENVTETLVSVNPKIYNYELSLFSQTKELEGIILPNRRITQLKSGIKRTLRQYINQFVNLYGKKVRKEYSDSFDWFPKWTVSLDSRFDVECPEFQWNTPTLREVLTDLMMVVDCIPVLRNNVITYMDLTSTGRNIGNDGHINYVNKSQSATDYVSEIKMNLQNVIQTETSGVNDSVRIKEVKPFTTNSGYIITSENITYKTRYPILKIKHLWFSFWTTCSTGWIYIKKDLCNLRGSNDSKAYNLVKEEKEYITLPVLNRLSDVSRDSAGVVNKAEEFAKYQNLSLSFIRGSNEISNWNSNIKTWWKFSDSYLEVLMKFICKYCITQGAQNVDGGASTVNNYFRPLIEVEYETTMNQVFSAGKSEVPSNSRTIIDNQTNSFVDSYMQGNLEYQKANRLGNKQVFINARYQIDANRDIIPSNIIKTGDSYQDYLIYQVTYRFYQSELLVNAIACKNYILYDYYTGIKSKVRTWVNAKDEASEMHELVKCYLEFSDREKVDKVKNHCRVSTLAYLTPLISPSNIPYSNETCIAAIHTISMNPSTSGTQKGYPISQLVKIVGNSIVYTTGFEDNSVFTNVTDVALNFNTSSAQERVIPSVKASYTDQFGGIPLQPVKYVDSNFECPSVTIGFDAHSNEVYGRCSDEYVRNIYPESEMAEQFDYLRKAVNLTSLGVYINGMEIDKDNREIPVISAQLEFCSDSKNIVFTKKFLEYQSCVRVGGAPVLRFYEAPLNSLNWRKPSLSNVTRNNSISIVYTATGSDYYNKNVKLSLANATPNKVYYICDSNDNIILASNGIRDVYLNVLYDRDTNIYDDNDNIVGTI